MPVPVVPLEVPKRDDSGCPVGGSHAKRFEGRDPRTRSLRDIPCRRDAQRLFEHDDKCRSGLISLVTGHLLDGCTTGKLPKRNDQIELSPLAGLVLYSVSETMSLFNVRSLARQ